MDNSLQQLNQNIKDLSGKTEELKKSESKVNLYEKIMIVIFLMFAIPLYLLIFKSHTNKQTGTSSNVEQNQNIYAELLNGSPTPIPTPVVIQGTGDIDKALQSLNSEDSRKLSGTFAQVETFVINLEQ